ncbi:MAG: aldehyde dehydrogenase family protein [Bacteriovoracaceae bacterium]|jgi:aldehyde dehydrogenase (NAD+)|nr:aldehyde dehydrogenase family protein [Bacteriovoracaceae bacterium]
MNIPELFSLQLKNKFPQKNKSVGYRVDKLLKVRELLTKYDEDICEALNKDLGKAFSETRLTEILPTIGMINYACKKLHKWSKDKYFSTPVVFKGASSYIRYEAKGNVLVISPWNYPFQLALYPVLSSFMAANTTILKPSEFTPYTNTILEKIITEVFDQDEVAVVHGGIQESNELLDHPFDHVFFTGSTEVGKIIMNKASNHLASVGLELGGKSPVFIDENVNLKEVMKKISWGKLVNAGQTCVAPDYVITTSKNIAGVVSGFKEYVQNAYGKNPVQSEDYCHIITNRHALRLKELVDDAVSKGAKVECGGQIVGERVFEPTVLTGVTKEMKVMQEEIFGPILPLVEKESIEEAISFINSYDNALCSYVFTKNELVEKKFMNETISGGVTINDVLTNVANAKLPFGGAGKSGIGRYHGHEGFLEFSNMRSVMNKKMDLGTSYFYPPYTLKKSQHIVSLLQKLRSFL